MASPQPRAIELPLPWGPVLRGLRWDGGPDRMLLLHAPGADIDAWGALPAQLAGSLAVETIAVDLPGHGLSDGPWEPARTFDLVRFLIRNLGDSFVSPPTALTPLPPSPIAMGEGEEGRSLPEAQHFVLAAGSIAVTTLTLAADLRLAGLVCLSPQNPDEEFAQRAGHEQADSGTSQSVPPSPSALGEGGRGVRVSVPKLLFAGSLAGHDLDTARRLASATGGWAVVTSLPVAERGTALLASEWGVRLAEETIAFLRDCRRRSKPYRGRLPTAPRDVNPD